MLQSSLSPASYSVTPTHPNLPLYSHSPYLTVFSCCRQQVQRLLIRISKMTTPASKSLSDVSLRSRVSLLHASDVNLPELSMNTARRKFSPWSATDLTSSKTEDDRDNAGIGLEASFNYTFENQTRVYVPGSVEDKKLLRVIDLHMWGSVELTPSISSWSDLWCFSWPLLHSIKASLSYVSCISLTVSHRSMASGSLLLWRGILAYCTSPNSFCTSFILCLTALDRSSVSILAAFDHNEQ